mmetsp:Transcript_9462/g.19385  ORF Transcript_9462/g.19385 Transcript_9462/m.19385 type:complete len:196 (+) Transcript_9462:593-1180(+)
MIKSATPAVVLLLALILGLESFSCWIVTTIALISGGLAVASYGEANFHLAGFLIVSAAVLMASMRMILSQVLVQGHSSRAQETGSFNSSHLLRARQLTLVILDLNVSFGRRQQAFDSSPGLVLTDANLSCRPFRAICGIRIAFVSRQSFPDGCGLHAQDMCSDPSWRATSLPSRYFQLAHGQIHFGVVFGGCRLH